MSLRVRPKKVRVVRLNAKSRRPKPTAWWKPIVRFLADLVSAVLAGVITSTIGKWLKG